MKRKRKNIVHCWERGWIIIYTSCLIMTIMKRIVIITMMIVITIIMISIHICCWIKINNNLLLGDWRRRLFARTEIGFWNGICVSWNDNNSWHFMCLMSYSTYPLNREPIAPVNLFDEEKISNVNESAISEPVRIELMWQTIRSLTRKRELQRHFWRWEPCVWGPRWKSY